jgi:TRAP-type uncharacterized transport system fused permease subunit
VPALVKLGVAVEAAHMFALYFAILSAITPPVALAVYAANSISQGTLWETGVATLKLGATGYIIPFMFVFGPSLLMIGSWDRILLTTITAVLGVTALAGSLHGYLLRPTRLWERLTLFGAAIVLIKPGLWTDLVGLGGLAAVVAAQQLLGARTPVRVASDRPAE